MTLRALTPVIALAALGGCASLGEPVLDADGCRPAMAIYQPAVGPGGAGQVMHIPRSCPAAPEITPEMMVALAALAGAEEALREQTDRDGAPQTPEPAPAPVETRAAIRQGIEDLCGWVFGGEPYSLEGLRQAAFDAGYGRGAPVQIVPLPEMLQQLSFSALGFTAVQDQPPGDGHGMAAFVSFHDPVCQIQVHGYEGETDEVLAALEADGWRRVGAPVRSGEWEAQRYQTLGAERPMTLVDNRLIDPADTTLRRVLNVVPGHDGRRGVLE